MTEAPVASPTVMPKSPPEASPRAAASAEAVARVAAARARKAAVSTGPAPGRILAAAGSVAAGIGLVALMAGAQQDIVVQVNPTPVNVQPAQIIIESVPGTSGSAGSVVSEAQVRIVEAATPAPQAAPQARVVAQSEGS